MNIIIPFSLRFVFGTQKKRLIEMVLLSTHNICFGSEIRKKYYAKTGKFSGNSIMVGVTHCIDKVSNTVS